MDADNIDVPYHSSVRWLSIGNVCDRVYELLANITQFFAEKDNAAFPELNQKEFVDDFSFTVDILKHLNVLNISLQGANLYVHDMYKTLVEFMENLQSWHTELASNNFESFPKLHLRSDHLTYD